MSSNSPAILDLDYAKKNHGKSGRAYKVKANFATLEIKKKIIYHCTIEINLQDRINNQDDKNRNQQNKIKAQKKLINKSNFELFKKLFKDNRSIFRSEPAFDCKQNLYSSTKFEFDGDRIELQVRMKVPEKKYPKTFDIVLIKQENIDLNRLNEKWNNGTNLLERELQALSVIINYGSKHFNLVLNSKIFPKYNDLIKERREIMENINFDIGDLKDGRFGHHSTVKFTENDQLQLCLDRVASVFNRGGSMIRIIEQFCTKYRGGNQENRNSNNRNNRNYQDRFRGGLKQQHNRGGNFRDGNRNDQQERININRNFRMNGHEIRALNGLLKGLEFEVNHLKTKPRFTIYELTSKSVSEITFRLKNKDNIEEEISVKNYFERAYGGYCSEKLSNNGGQLFGNLPCVQVNKINPTYYPLEVVEICHDQYCRKKLNSNQQSIMTRKCGTQNPSERFSDNENQLRNLNKFSSRCENDFLRSFDIRIKERFNIIDGRILDIPSLIGGGPNSGTIFKPSYDTQWRPEVTCGFKTEFDSTNFRWGVINIRDCGSRPLDKRDVDNLIRTLVQSSQKNKIRLEMPNFTEYEVKVNNEKEIDDLIHWAKSKKGANFLIILIPNSESLYNKIKFISECKEGIVTQCISQTKNRQFSSPAYCGNVILKINSKLGGVNAILEKESKVGFLRGKTMIMGFDVNHGSKGSKDQTQYSIASVVGTYDSKMVNYHSVSVVQEKDHNEIVKLDVMIKELLNKFYKRNSFYPINMVVFRDGVNDGQFRQVMSSEIGSMKKAFRELNDPKSECNPKITYIICQKGHNTRFLPENPRDALKSGNVMPGLVVDRQIVSNFNEFYLCSHFGALGTSRPTRYIALYDEAKFNGDEIQRATYNLSFLFPRCLKAVSIVPPVLYAHLAAKRNRSYISCLNGNLREMIGNFELLAEREKIELNNAIRVRGNLESKLYYI